MEESLSSGHLNAWCESKDLFIRNQELTISGHILEKVGKERSREDFAFGRRQEWRLDAFDSVQVRLDPPTDLGYQQTVQMLRFGAARQKARKTEFVNPLAVLLDSTSKLEPLLFAGLKPPTVVSCERNVLVSFAEEQGFTVLKPLNSFRCLGVENLNWHTPQGRSLARRKLRSLTNGFTNAVVLQRAIPRRNAKEVRVWFLDGNVLAHAMRTKLRNSSATERLRPAAWDAGLAKLTRTVGRHLMNRGIRLAAVDLMGIDVLEVNFSSPGLIVELEALQRQNLARSIVGALASFRAR
jgi:glutathione synthase